MKKTTNKLQKNLTLAVFIPFCVIALCGIGSFGVGFLVTISSVVFHTPQISLELIIILGSIFGLSLGLYLAYGLLSNTKK